MPSSRIPGRGTREHCPAVYARAAPVLRRIGIHVDFDNREGDTNRTRTIKISFLSPASRPETEPEPDRADKGGISPSIPSIPSAAAPYRSNIKDVGLDAKSDANHFPTVPTVRHNQLKTKAFDAKDAKDAKIPTQSARDGATSAQPDGQAAARQIVAKAKDLGIPLLVKNGELMREAGWVDESFLSEIRENRAAIIAELQNYGGAA
jgi:hypothetical protein